MCENAMNKKMPRMDKQHYVSQSYLRNFSPDYEEYQKQKDTLGEKRRKKYKKKMRIHYFEINEYNYGFSKIETLARVNRYLLPEVDKIVKKTENKLSFLRDVIENKSEDFLNQCNHRETLIEIANCLVARSLVFRTHATVHCALTTGEMIDGKGDKFAELIYTDEGAEFLQTALLTNNIEILLPLMLKAYRFVVPSDDSDATFQERLEKQGLQVDELVDSFRNMNQPPIQPFLSSTLFPILIKNNSEFQFITGDACVAKGNYQLSDLKTKIPVFLFPINPELAILFLEEEKSKNEVPRIVNDRWIIFAWNRHIYNCSVNYLFANSREPLQWVTRLPRDFESTIQDLRKR